jgi:hypothetical protein
MKTDNPQSRQFGAPQAAAQKDGERGVLSLSAKGAKIYTSANNDASIVRVSISPRAPC